jgi:tRNA pseudouridine32 synthase/23S rRNA pseudouridine746 synthase
MTPDDMLARLLYRDGLMLVVDKPAGLSVHHGPKGGASLEDYFAVLRFGLPRDPALAHRLDKDTSGCLVLGRHRKALALLGKLFKNGDIGKTYWAVVEGGPEAADGRIDIPLGKLDENRGWWMKPDPQGKPSSTVWKVMGRFFSPPPCGEGSGVGVQATHRANTGDYPPPQPSPTRGEGVLTPPGGSTRFTWLALEPLTGRTHQLRVHCAEMGWPIVGDNIYGSAPRAGGPPLHLHAREIVVPISKNKPAVKVTASAPAHMRDLLNQCGWVDDSPSDQLAPVMTGDGDIRQQAGPGR